MQSPDIFLKKLFLKNFSKFTKHYMLLIFILIKLQTEDFSAVITGEFAMLFIQRETNYFFLFFLLGAFAFGSTVQSKRTISRLLVQIRQISKSNSHFLLPTIFSTVKPSIFFTLLVSFLLVNMTCIKSPLNFFMALRSTCNTKIMQS